MSLRRSLRVFLSQLVRLLIVCALLLQAMPLGPMSIASATNLKQDTPPKASNTDQPGGRAPGDDTVTPRKPDNPADFQFDRAARVKLLASVNLAFTSYVYTHSDILIFSYTDNTTFEVYHSSGALVWTGTLNAGQHYALSPGAGVYLVAASNAFALNVGDALTSYVLGYYAIDQNGKGLSTLFYTYQSIWANTQYDPNFIVFAYENNTQVTVKDTTTGQLIWSGTLNSGQHYVNNTVSGTYLTVSSNRPVSALSYTDQGFYVHANTGTFVGTAFHTYVGNSGGWIEDLNLIAYDNTSVTVVDSSTGVTLWSGLINAGHVSTISNLNGRYVSVYTSGRIAVSVSPFTSWPNGQYFHSLYGADSSGSGIGTYFLFPTIPTASSIACRLVLFSYVDGSDINIINSAGSSVWSGTLNKAQSQTLYPSSLTVNRITSSGDISALLDCGDSAGASFAPVHYAAINVAVTSPLGGSYRNYGSILVEANVSLQGLPLLGGEVSGQIVPATGGEALNFGLNDQGLAGDQFAGDGRYAATIALLGPAAMPADNYFLLVSAQKSIGGKTTSGTGSSIFNVQGPPAGSLSIVPTMSCPHSAQVYVGDTCNVSITVTYPDSSIHGDGTASLVSHQPDRTERRSALTLVGNNLWQGTIVFGQAGRHLLDFAALPALGSAYIGGYGSAVIDVQVSSQPLTVVPYGLPKTFQALQLVVFTTTVSLGTMPVSGANVRATINPGGEVVDLTSLGNGTYAGTYVPSIANSYTIDFTASAPLYQTGMATSSFTIIATSMQLLDKVVETAQGNARDLDVLKSYADKIARDGDWFWAKIPVDKFERNVNFIVNVISLGLNAGQLGKELEKAAAKSTAPVAARFAGINLFAWLRNKADLSMDGRIFRSWATRLETVVQSGLLVDYLNLGRLPPGIGKGVLLRAWAYYASQMLAESMDAVVAREFTEYLAEQRSDNTDFLHSALYPIFVRSADEDISLVNEYAQVIQMEPPNWSATIQSAMVGDLTARQRANMIFVSDTWQRNMNLWTAQDMRESEESAPFFEKYGWTLWKIAVPILVGIACGGPVGAAVGVALSAETLVEDWIHDSNNLSMDENMSDLAYGSMGTILETKETLIENSQSGLASVRRGDMPQTPKGQILSVHDRVEKEYLLFEKKAATTLVIKNTGSVGAFFNVRTSYNRLTNWNTNFESFWIDVVDDIAAGEQNVGWIYLDPGQSRTVEVVYKDKARTGVDMRPNDHDAIDFNLIAQTLDGHYFANWKSNQFEPGTLTNSADTPSAALPSIISYPVSTRVGRDRFGEEYTAYIRVENPLAYPTSMVITQTVPAGLKILSPDGGTILDDAVRWQRVVQPHETFEFALAVRNVLGSASVITMPASTASFFVSETSSELTFTGTPVAIAAPTRPIVYLPLIAKGFGSDYQWLDASVGGSIVAQGDETYQYVNLPFAFNFYGNTYYGVYVSSNGFVSFGAGYTNFSNTCIPTTATPNNAIYAFWDDLVPAGGSDGNVYVRQIDSSTFVIEWHRVRKYGTSDYETFEIVLRNNNSIKLQYQAISNVGSATVGAENVNGTLAKQYICNGGGSPLTNSLAIQYNTP